jgi:Tfp pilus assembly protein PilF
MGPRPNPVSGPLFLPKSPSAYVQSAMLPSPFVVVVTNATRARSVWAAILSLFAAIAAYSGLPQATVQNGAGIQDHFQRAQTALQANDLPTAEKEFREILALDPKNAAAHTNLGVLALGHGDCRTASGEFRAALVVQPSLAKAWALLGICQKRLGDPAARATLEKSFQTLREKPLRLQVGMELASLYDREGDLDATASVMRSLVELDPENVDILYTAQRVYSELADDTLNKLAVVAPGSARMQQVIAERLVNGGDLQNATQHYRKALEIDAQLPGVRYELAEAILEASPHDAQAQAEAEEELETVVKVDGQSARTECLVARIAVLRADLDNAYAHYNRALTLSPKDAEAQVGLGRVLATLGKSQEALKYLRMAVQSDPLNGEAHYRLSSVCRRLQLKEEADKELHLFQEIKQTKERVRELYRQMNRKTTVQDEQMTDPES